MNEWSERPSILRRLKNDIDDLLKSCRDVWDSVNENDEGDSSHELASFRSSGRFYEIRRTEWGDDERLPSLPEHSQQPLTTREKAPDVGKTLAASLSASCASIIPTLVIGTQSAFATLVPVGTQVALPTYTLSNGQVVLDHYSLFTASSQISGWYPNPVMTLSLSTIPVFVGTFALTHVLDSVHSYLNNRCSGKAAIAHVLRGSTAGAVVGSLYYGTVGIVGISHAPVVSAVVCLGWLITTRVRATDVAVGSFANLAGLGTFLISGSAWVSMLGAIGAGLVGSSLLAWLSHKWSERLNDRLCETASEILSVSGNACKHEVNSAFRKLARQFHPDKQGSRDYFELISVSKEILLSRLERKANETPSHVSILMSMIFSLSDSFLQVSSQDTNPPPPSIELPTDFLDSPD